MTTNPHPRTAQITANAEIEYDPRDGAEARTEAAHDTRSILDSFADQYGYVGDEF